MPTPKKRTSTKKRSVRVSSKKKKSFLKGFPTSAFRTRASTLRFGLFVVMFALVGFLVYRYAFAADPKPVGTVTGVGNLIFSDEFDGNSISSTNWQTGWFGTGITGPVNGEETACYDSRLISVSGGNLNLRLESNSSSECKDRNNRTAQYRGSLITSKRANFTEGYYEARMYIPGSSNGRSYNWPAFWTNGQSWPRDGEIDIYESLGGEACWNYHWSGGSTRSTCPLSDSTGWHTFAVKRERDRLTYYYDGRQVGTHTTGVVTSPHYIILNNTQGNWGGSGNAPQTVLVDYVRVWALGSGSGDGGTGNPGGGNPTNTPPTVSLGSLNSSYTAPATVNLTATASDSDGITKVEFFNGNTKLGEDTTSPYSYNWTNVPAGSYSVTARATDTKGATATSSARTFTVQSSSGGNPTPPPTSGGPSVTLGRLNPTYTTADTIKITADARDSSGIKRVSFYNGDTWLGTDSSAPYEWTLSRPAAGKYSITANATNNRDRNTFSSPVEFTVVPASGGGGGGQADRQPPSVPTGLTRSLGFAWLSYHLQINWNPSTDTGGSGIKEYTVSISSPRGSESFRTQTNSFRYTKIQKDTTYTISVRAHDKAGNQSAYSQPVTAHATCQWIFCGLR